jgi:hypothetical protein
MVKKLKDRYRNAEISKTDLDDGTDVSPNTVVGIW